MGLVISRLVSSLSFAQDTRILMLGLDAAGKTTTLYKLKLGEFVTSVPTIGFNVETVSYKKLNMTIWDVGGQDKIRALWQHYYNGSDALIWIVDSTDVDRMKECRDELHHVCASDSLRHAAVLVYTNKQDAPKAERPDVVAGHLGLHTLPQREWYIQPCSALMGDGLVEGLEWLNKTLRAGTTTVGAQGWRAG